MIILKGSETREDIFVNEENIVLAERKETRYTYVVFKSGATALVDETPREIRDLIREDWGA